MVKYLMICLYFSVFTAFKIGVLGVICPVILDISTLALPENVAWAVRINHLLCCQTMGVSLAWCGPRVTNRAPLCPWSSLAVSLGQGQRLEVAALFWRKRTFHRREMGCLVPVGLSANTCVMAT